MPWHNDQVSDAETAKLLSLAKSCLTVAGDFVEMGCYRGDTSLLLAELLQSVPQNNSKPSPSSLKISPPKPPKTLYLYDSFAGLPAKSAEDQSPAGVAFEPGSLATSKRELKSRFLRANLKVPKITKAWFADLEPSALPATIAFAFLDSDFYSSVKTSLRLVTPKISPGGLILVHDYHNPALPGVTAAVDEFLASYQTSSPASRKLLQTTKQPVPRLTRFHSLAILSFS